MSDSAKKARTYTVCVLHLEVRLCEYAGKLSCSVGAVCEGVQVSEDLLQELHVVLPHWRQTWLLQALLLLTHEDTHIHMQMDTH